MKKLNRIISLILCAAMLFGMFPLRARAVNNDENGTCTIDGDTVYELVSESTVTFTANGKTSNVVVGNLTNRKNYLIVTGNTAGNHDTLSWDGYNLTNSRSVQVNNGGPNGRVYITNPGNATVWTANIVENTGDDAGRQENDWRFNNGSIALNAGDGLSTTNYQNTSSGAQFSIRNHYLSWWYADRYARSSNNWKDYGNAAGERYGAAPNDATHVYFYEEIKLQNVYSLDAVEYYAIALGDELTLDAITKQIRLNGENYTGEDLGGSYSFEIRESPENALELKDGKLVAIANGEATVRVVYTWRDGTQNQIWDDITVEVTGDPYYTVDIKDNGTSANIVTVKSVTNQTTKQLTADVLKYGRLPVADATVTWASSNASIVTVDANGMLHFTGEEGTATIFAVYKDGDTEYMDRITVSASAGNYIVPADGTNDFPEYPNEGSIRFDKTAQAVGDFNKTGIAQVELSMTGVPYTTNNILDVVLLIDKSSSMTDTRVKATREATKVFVKNLVYNEDGTFTGNRIYVGCYVGGNPQYAGQNQHNFKMEDVTRKESAGYQIIDSEAEYKELLSRIDTTVVQQDSSYGTEYAQSLAHGYKLLNDSKSDGNKQFCVFMTDGIPNVYQGENTKLTSSSEMAQMFTGNNYQTRGPDYQYELHTTQMKQNGVTVFTVGLGLNNTNSALSGASATQCLNVASMLLNDMSGPAGETAADRDTGGNISKQDEYFFSVADANAAAGMENVFTEISKKIVEAAKDVVVTDQMADEYTMVFEVPNKGTAENIPAGQEFYIEILDYTLDQTTHERKDEGTSLMKLYMGVDVQNVEGKNVTHYYAASQANSKAEGGVRTNQYPAPVFAQKPLGSMYYWTTTDITGSSTYSGVSVTIDEVTYYFDFRGIKQAEGEAVPENWYNMTSGAFASGTVTEDKHGDVLGEPDDTSYSNDLIIATPYFVYNASTKMLYWTLEKIGRNETVLRYFLYLDESAGYHGNLDVDAGSYPTNEGADLTYTNYQDNLVQQEFPKPQMTWHGAQVTYVFYLVNSNGQPVNRAGRVVPFTEAVYVTDSYTESVIWSEADQRNSLAANTLAKDIVPSVYTLYDEDAYYNIHVFANEEKMGADNHFQIGGNSSKVQSTYVFNTKADKNMYNKYGTYAKQGIVKVDCTVVNSSHDNLAADHHTEPGLDYYDTTVAFAVLWIPALAPEEIVVDYGLDVVVDVTRNDLAAAEPIGLMATPPLQDNGDPVEINKGQFEDISGIKDELELFIGTGDAKKKIATATLEGNSIRINLDRANGMHFTSDILFYYVSQVQFYDDHGALQSEYMYTSFRVIPATTIYYEEDYVTFDDKWSPHNGTPNPNATQDVDRPGPNRVGAGYDADNPYGYDSAYLNCTEFSLNTAKVTTVTAISTTPPATETDPTTPTDQVQSQAEDTESNDGTNPTEDQTDPTEDPTEPTVPQVPGPTATFTFTGTGFDIIGRTDNETTSILVKVKRDGTYVPFRNDVTVNNGGTISTKIINGDTIFVDTYFEGAEGVTAIKQVPVVTVRDLNYGTYTVTVEVVINNDKGSPYAHGAEGKFYLDAVRIYDPAGILTYTAGNTIAEAYKADNECTPRREEIGNVLLQEFGSDKVFAQAMFVDKDGSISDINKYMTWGPNNELYLAAGQSLKLTVDNTYVPKLIVPGNIEGLADMQLGMKLASGTSTTVTISSTTGKSKTVTLTSATDLNFSIMDYYAGTLTIQNSGPGVVSLTNVKVTVAPAVTSASFSRTERLDEAPKEPDEHVQTTEPEEIPKAPNTVIARGVLLVKETIAAVIIAVAEGMESISKLLENIANALFAGGGK